MSVRPAASEDGAGRRQVADLPDRVVPRETLAGLSGCPLVLTHEVRPQQHSPMTMAKTTWSRNRG